MYIPMDLHCLRNPCTSKYKSSFLSKQDLVQLQGQLV
jgi:hypothetical protein